MRCRDLEFGVRIDRSGAACGTGGAARTTAEHEGRKCECGHQHAWVASFASVEECHGISRLRRQAWIHMATFGSVLSEWESGAPLTYCGGFEIPVDATGEDRWHAVRCAEFEDG